MLKDGDFYRDNVNSFKENFTNILILLFSKYDHHFKGIPQTRRATRFNVKCASQILMLMKYLGAKNIKT